MQLKMQSNHLEELENRINYSFKNKELLLLSLTHPSYANENNIDKVHTNQRLEFLGDAVLELISSDFLYKLYVDYPEGTLTKTRAKLVCEENLSNVARELSLYQYLYIGKGENNSSLKHSNSTMCDTLEAVIGAIYLDGGIENAKLFINSFILTEENLLKTNNDYKSSLQEKANYNNCALKYEVIKESGPDHNKTFEIAVYYNDKKLAVGIGKSKKEAEQDAAKKALNILEV
jgi:ribonuclease-3